jgi:hypothetical protein
MSFTVAVWNTAASPWRFSRRCGFLLWLSAALTGLLLMCGSARATSGHEFSDQFGAAGNNAGEFLGGPLGIGVLQSSGDLFVADPGHMLGDGSPDPRVERFDGAGLFESAFSVDGSAYGGLSGLAVDSSGGGAVYVSAAELATGAGAVLKYTSAGVFVHGLDASTSGTTINGGSPIAVDPADGSVYAIATDTSTFAQVVDVFDGVTGSFLTSFAGTQEGGFVCPSGLAVDDAHRVYVLDRACFGAGRVEQYSSAGAFADFVGSVIVGSSPVAYLTAAGVAVDPVSATVYVAEIGSSGLQVTEFGAGGSPVGQQFSATNVGNLAGMAIDHGSGTIFTSDNANPFVGSVVERFTAFEGPTVTTTAASAITAESVTLNGDVDPGGVAAFYHFEWGPDANYGTSTPNVSAGGGSGAVPASASTPGLRPNSLYHYRIVGTNASGLITGGDRTVTTAPVAPTLPASPFATEVTTDGANIHGVIDAGHSETNFHIEYGTTTAYGAVSEDKSAGGADGPKPVALTLSHLQPGTLYHFRITADNGTGGPQSGPDGTVTTAPGAPAGATDLSTRRATLTGVVDPHGVATTYHFNYGPSPSHGTSTEEVDAGSDAGEHAVSDSITDLEPGTLYHVQIVATSGGVTWTGADGTFTMPLAPVATAGDATAITTSAATVAGTADTHGLPGSYYFEVASLDSGYRLSTPEQQVPSGASARRVSAALSGLPADETFVVQFVVSSNESTDRSDQISFATMPVPRVFPAPPPPSALYGCTEPGLGAFNSHPKPGDTIRVTGSDLGVGGTVTLGDQSLTPDGWTDTGFTVDIPNDATGTLPLTANCGRMTNTIAIAIYKRPSNAFTIVKQSVSGAVASVTVKVPGPGKLQTSARHTKATSTTITKASTKTIKVRLTALGVKALAKAGSAKLSVNLRFRYTPAGGTGATLTSTIIFRTRSER